MKRFIPKLAAESRQQHYQIADAHILGHRDWPTGKHKACPCFDVGEIKNRD
ncbi:hypothetical protein [Vibrio navarrensis]|uniref:hypothetical protein n=1 Tax=Vibrio navarrensis TaxID=29495 RepID=UPI0018699A67|nr:hypothetical protein [Vibrio navarrensis]